MNKRNVILFLLICFLAFIFIKQSNKSEIEKINEHQVRNSGILNETDKEFHELFTEQAISKLSLSYKVSSNKEFPYAAFYYDTDYRIIVHKIELMNVPALDSLITLEKDRRGVTRDIVYAGCNGDNISFYHRKSSNSYARKIIVGYSDSLVATISLGNYIKSYNLLGTMFSIRYDSLEPKDIVIESQQGFKSGTRTRQLLNLNLVLYKREKSLFIILAYPRDKDGKIDGDFILKLLAI